MTSVNIKQELLEQPRFVSIRLRIFAARRHCKELLASKDCDDEEEEGGKSGSSSRPQVSAEVRLRFTANHSWKIILVDGHIHVFVNNGLGTEQSQKHLVSSGLVVLYLVFFCEVTCTGYAKTFLYKFALARS